MKIFIICLGGCQKALTAFCSKHDEATQWKQVHSLCVDSRPGNRLRLAKGPPSIHDSCVKLSHSSFLGAYKAVATGWQVALLSQLHKDGRQDLVW